MMATGNNAELLGASGAQIEDAVKFADLMVLRVTREAIQFHGAIAMTDDCDIGLYFKRAVTLAAWLGNADAHRRRFVALGR